MRWSTASPGTGLAAAPLPVAEGVQDCSAWSRHAADLAVLLSPQIEHWPDSPSTQSMVRHGDLERLRDGTYIVPGACGTPALRAVVLGCALGPALRSDHVLAGASASWILIGGTPPPEIEIISRSHRTVLGGVHVRNSDLDEEDVEVVGGAPVTVPGRTATDLLRFQPACIAVDRLSALLRTGHVCPSEVRRRLEAMSGSPGSRRGRTLLEEAESRSRRDQVPASR